MKTFAPTTLLIGCLSVLVFALVIPTSSSNQLAAVASTAAFTFKESTLSVTEGDRLKVTIVAPATLTSTTRVKVTTKAGTAKSGTDFTPVNTTVTFYKGGLKEKSITLVTKNDTAQEEPETLTLSLSVGNKVVNTRTVTLNNKGTTGTTGSSLPATANQGNTLGGNPSFTTYSPQGLPQPMNPRCKPVPSKYKFEQTKFPPNNPSNPFYTWAETFGGAFPLDIGLMHHLALHNRKYMTWQFQVPPKGSPIETLNVSATATGYPRGSGSNGITFISECPWQDYYDEVIASDVSHTFVEDQSPIIQEWRNAGTPLQGDLYERVLAEYKRIRSIANTSGFCEGQIGPLEGQFLYGFTANKETFERALAAANNESHGAICYLKPGGTYYLTLVFPDLKPLSEFPDFPGAANPLHIEIRVSDENSSTPIASRPGIESYGIYSSLKNIGQTLPPRIPIVKPKKLCRDGSSNRLDCWFGQYGLAIEQPSQELRDADNVYRWIKKRSMHPNDVTCRAGVREGALCQNTDYYDTTCSTEIQGYTCAKNYISKGGAGVLNGGDDFGPN